MGGVSRVIMVCMTMLGKHAGVLVVLCGVDMGPLEIIGRKMDPGLNQPWDLMVQSEDLV